MRPHSERACDLYRNSMWLLNHFRSTFVITGRGRELKLALIMLMFWWNAFHWAHSRHKPTSRRSDCCKLNILHPPIICFNIRLLPLRKNLEIRVYYTCVYFCTRSAVCVTSCCFSAHVGHIWGRDLFTLEWTFWCERLHLNKKSCLHRNTNWARTLVVWPQSKQTL